MLTTKIDLPQIDEQITIAKRLGGALREARGASAGCREQASMGSLLQQKMLAEAFVDLVPVAIRPSPAATNHGWTWRPLLDVARLESGHTPSRRRPEWWGGDVPWLALPDIRKLHGKFAYETTERTNEAGLANSAARLLPVGTVCLCRDASVGFATILGRPMATSQHFANWVCNQEELDPEFLLYALMASHEYLRSLGSGSVIKTIYMPTIQSFQVCAPAIDAQRRVASALRERLAYAEVLCDGLKVRLEEIERLPSRLLTAVFGTAG